jgi:hypothetical protein
VVLVFGSTHDRHSGGRFLLLISFTNSRFVVFVIFGVALMWVAIEKGTYSALPEEVLRFALRLHPAVFL